MAEGEIGADWLTASERSHTQPVDAGEGNLFGLVTGGGSGDDDSVASFRAGVEAEESALAEFKSARREFDKEADQAAYFEAVMRGEIITPAKRESMRMFHELKMAEESHKVNQKRIDAAGRDLDKRETQAGKEAGQERNKAGREASQDQNKAGKYWKDMVREAKQSKAKPMTRGLEK